MKLNDRVESLSGVGPVIASTLNQLGIETIAQLLEYLPRKHVDYSIVSKAAQLKPGEATIKASIVSISQRNGRRGMSITEAIASDETGSVKLVWFNQRYRAQSLKKGQQYFFSGTFSLSHQSFSFINPSVEPVSDMPVQTARIVPVYPERKGITSAWMRRMVTPLLPLCQEIEDYLPIAMTKKLNLLEYGPTIANLHYPSTKEVLDQAYLRLRFDSLFPILLGNELTKAQLALKKSIPIPFKADIAKDFVDQLPFKLTDDQRRVIWQICKDIALDQPMNRLVEGDVGSGKTVVAVMAAVMALKAGYNVAFMAPTELLAKQHAKTINKLLMPLGMADKLFYFSGSVSKSKRLEMVKQINNSKGNFIVGTQALLFSEIDWHSLALLIIDEQHRFGVDQRTKIQQQAGHTPHFLSITATPIPRSLALTLLSDLKLSILKTKPADRLEIKTELIAPSSRLAFLRQLREQLELGRQAYIVAPTIDDHDDSHKTDVGSLASYYQQKLPKARLGILHGRLPAAEQAQVMSDFVAQKLDLLVATTVIEVGVDVPNATVMAIHGPDRFGLAQLHQLRGRVGRGAKQSYCYVMLSDAMAPPIRLRQFAMINDGFKLSELDLELRGPGAVYGTLQHGRLGFGIGSLNDQNLLNHCREAVNLFVQGQLNLLEYPLLAQRVHAAQQLTYLN